MRFVKNINMKNNLIFAIIDNIFVFALLFILNLIWCLYFISSPILALIVSVIASFFQILLYRLISRKHRHKNSVKLQELKHMQQIRDTFIYMPNNQVVNFFLKLAKSRHTASISKNLVLIGQEQKVALFPLFKMDSIGADKIIEIYNDSIKTNVKKVVILCNTYDLSVLNVIKNFRIPTLVLDYKQTYSSLLKEYNFYPEITVKESTEIRVGFKQILLLAFDKKKTRGYVISALFIAFSSMFVKYKVYYLIVATCLLIMAILCLCNFKFKETKDPLEHLLG